MPISASVIVPTHNRPNEIAETLQHLLGVRTETDFEIVVVDDGSNPPLSLSSPGVRLVRTPGIERSRARNLGAVFAAGDLLVFLDDDIAVSPDLVSTHQRSAVEFGDVLCVGRISLPGALCRSPFGRFRQLIENSSQARPRGFVGEKNFCTAANMSIRRGTFLALGGFDPAMLSGEDQDLALRFTALGKSIVFLPEADGLHRDHNADIASYCRRHEWGARAMAPLLRRYPDRADSKARLRFEKGFALRRVLSRRLILALLLRGVSTVERVHGSDRVLLPIYRLLLGLHLFRGFREGLLEVRLPPPIPLPIAS